MLFQLVDKCLYVGEYNKKYYEHYGVRTDKLVYAPHSVDNAFFKKSREFYLSSRDQIRRQWGIDDDRPVFLFVGKFVQKKQPLLLLEAFKLVSRYKPCHLVYVGDGPLRSQLDSAIKRQGLKNVTMAGFLNQSEITKAYVGGDILVLPSKYEETWGLVVNEAMNCGLPIVISDRVGCGRDLVCDNENGFIVPHGSAVLLAKALSTLANEPNKRLLFGKKSLEIIRNWDLKQTAAGILAALRSSIG